MDKYTKLSEAIEHGATYLGECKTFWNADKTAACAIGTALIVVMPERANSPILEQFQELAERFGLNQQYLHELSTAHWTRRKTRQQIIDELKSKGL